MNGAALQPLLFFSDLDGTLLDHQDYSYAAAEPALSMLRESRIPLVLASSKTASEIAPLRRQMGFEHCPAIVENGAGLLPAGGDAGGTGTDHYGRLIALIDRLPDALRQHFQGFHDWDIDEISRRTGLDGDQAGNAASRRYSEPGIWSGDATQFAEFERHLKKDGITVRRGGRFVTLSFGGSKADRMSEIIRDHAPNTERPYVIAFGDAPNDVEMLEMADRGIIVANPAGATVPTLSGEENGRITRTKLPGPAGWNDAALSILAERGMSIA